MLITKKRQLLFSLAYILAVTNAKDNNSYIMVVAIVYAIICGTESLKLVVIASNN